MPAFRAYACQQDVCPFHGAHEHMNNVYNETKNEWDGYPDKVFETPYQIETLSKSLYSTHYGDKVSAEIKGFL